MNIISRKEAKNLGGQYYFTGVPCKRGHISNRLVSTYNCIECSQLLKNKYANDPARKEIASRRTRNWYQLNTERAKATSKMIQQGNPDRHYGYVKKWESKNPANRKKYHKMYRDNPKNKGKILARVGKRRAQRLNAFPKWANDQIIMNIYEEARIITSKTGNMHHVDHIVPLRGELVCGLHCEDNLQILLAEDNLNKSNKFCGE